MSTPSIDFQSQSKVASDIVEFIQSQVSSEVVQGKARARGENSATSDQRGSENG
jgi:hypothetical protein